MSSATDTIRAMLDERGVEHFDGTEGTYWGGSAPARDGLGSVYRFSAREVVGGLNVHLLRVTPEQAIEATLGGDLKAENAKLRELVRNVEHYERFGCQGCPHSGSCGAGTLYDEDCAMSREIEREKRELGIEADA